MRQRIIGRHRRMIRIRLGEETRLRVRIHKRFPELHFGGEQG
jgi:hypothetical protein